MKKILYSLLLSFFCFQVSAQTNFSATLTGNPVSTTGWTMASNSSVSGNSIVLTNATTNISGYIYYSTPTTLTTCAQFTVNFEFQITDTSAPPADGLAFWYISNPPTGFTLGQGIGLPNNPNGLMLIMDTYDNDGTPQNNPLISLRGIDGTFNYDEASNAGLVGTAQPAQHFILDGAWHSCKLTYDNGNIAVYYDGSTTALLTGYYPLNISGYFGFSASTGALWSKHSIRNVNITGILPPAPPTVPSSTVTYCQFDVATPLTATGVNANLNWYSSATSTTPLPSAPTPNTSVAGTTTYYVTQQGANGCESNRTPINVVVIPKPNPPVSPSMGLCKNTGDATLTATGQNLKWYETATSTTPMASAPVVSTTAAPASFTYYVSQTVNGCESDRTQVNINVGDKPAPPVVSSPVNFCQYDPEQFLSATGQNLLWYTTPTGGIGNPAPPKPPTNYPGTTSYYVTQSNNGCESDRMKLDVIVTEKPNGLIVAAHDSVCQHATDTFYYYGSGVASDIYNWVTQQGATYISGGGQGPYIVQFDNPGVYKIRMTVNHNGCLSPEAIHSVTVNPAPAIHLSSGPTICADQVLDVTLNAATSGINGFQWDFAGGEVVYSSVPGGPYGVRWGNPGNYVISVTGSVNGCPSTAYQDTITVLPRPDAHIQQVVNPVVCTGDTVLLTPQTYRDTMQYTWTPQMFFYPNDQIGQENGGALAIVTKPTFLTLTVHDKGCVAQDSVYINAQPCCTVALPTAFTPNNDQHNDKFQIITKGNHRLSNFRVLNRWGQVVFETADENTGWDGTKAGVPQEMGTYYYYLKYYCSDGKMYEQHGEVTLVR